MHVRCQRPDRSREVPRQRGRPFVKLRAGSVRVTAAIFRTAFLLAVLLLAGCGSSQIVTPVPVRLRIAGSTSMMLVLRDLAGAYQASHPNAWVDLRGGGSAVGISELRAGQADLAASSWQGDTAAVPAGLRAVPVARDAIAIIVPPSNNVPGLTLLQLKAIYQGETLDWSGLGGPPLETLVVSREDGSGTRAAFESLVMGNERVTLSAVVMPSSQAVVDYVAAHPNAIGYVTMSELNGRVRAVPIEEAAPTAANARSGVYHLTRVLYLYVPSPTPLTTQNFIDFVLSPAGQTIVARHHVPLR